ncbi:MAG: hypothetical protein N3B10_14430, partial [Armatimonadetes bacterium]|nr:hypothetical protein [Armatimonadota bacterium]
MIRAASVCAILLVVCFSFSVTLVLELWDIRRGESVVAARLTNDALTTKRNGRAKHWSIAFMEGSRDAKDLLPIVLSELNKTFEQAVKKAKNEYGNGLVAEAMANAGFFDQAIQVADGIKSHISRVTVLLHVGSVAAETKQFDKAIQVANKVAEILKSKPIPFVMLSVSPPSLTFRSFVKTMAEAGFYDQAIKLARFVDLGFHEIFAFHDIAEAAIKAKHYKQFFRIVQKEKDAETRSILLQSFAHKLAETGHFDKAIQTANGIEDSCSRVEALCGIAKKIAKAGQKERALTIFDQTIKIAPKADRRRSMLTHVIVEGMAEAGFFDQALEIVKSVEESYSRSELLCVIAKSMANAGHFDQAFETAKSIEYP